MRILVTGLKGFTGRYVQSELGLHGHSVIGLSSDLTDYSAVETEVAEIQPEALVHLAGIAFVGHGNTNSFYEVNLIGTRNLLESLSKHVPNISSILLASSANVYGNRSEGALNESALPAPSNDYAVSKLAMEQMAELWVKRLPLFIVRPFNYTGVGQDEKFLIPKIVNHFRANKTNIELGNIDVWREFGDVRDIAVIYRKLLDKCPVGEKINVCTGHTYSLREIVVRCEKITGHTIKIKVNPNFVRKNEVRTLKGDKSCLESLIGTIETHGIEETLSWMLQNNMKNAE